MPPEPLPWDRKEFPKERKHEKSESVTIRSVARWREPPPPPHHVSRDFGRGGSADYRRPPGHDKQAGWQLGPEESGHGHTPSRSGEKILEGDSCRSSGSRGDGKYSRNSRENRGGSFSQKDGKEHSWEASVVSPNSSGRQLDVNDQRSVEDMLTYTSHPHSDIGSTWDQPHFKNQHDKSGSANDVGTGHKYSRENSLGSIDWKPRKWTRSGSLSSRGSGFSHSSSSKSIGVDSSEAKTDVQPRNATPVRSPSGDVVPCMMSTAPLEEITSRKKQRLNWGEGLAKYEKKKVEGPDEGMQRNSEPAHSLGSNLADKSPRVNGFSGCASPATPSSVACSSSPGLEDKPFLKTVNVGDDTSNLSGSPGPVTQHHVEGFPFNLEDLELNPIANLSSALIELLQSDDVSSVDSSSARSTAVNKLLIWKGDILKVLEMTESEIDHLENELKSLRSDSGSSCCPCRAVSSSLPDVGKTKSCEEQGATSDLIPRPTPLKMISSKDVVVEKTVNCNGVLEKVNAVIKDDDIDSPGTATSKLVEPSCPSDVLKQDEGSGCLDTILSKIEEAKVGDPVSDGITDLSVSKDVGQLTENKSDAPSSGDVSLCADGDDILCNILTSNKDSANRSSEVFYKLLPEDQCLINVSEASQIPGWQSDSFMKEKFTARKRFLSFKQRVITLKFRAFLQLWKEDMRLLSLRKYRAKSQKRFELSLRTSYGGYQKHLSSIRSRFSSPSNLSLTPTTEIINIASKLLSDSQVKLYRNTLRMPMMILDKKEKMMSRFTSNNGLVEDPYAVEKERAMINPWSSEEREIFMDKLATFGKDFGKIASFLDHKTTADCVEFYYKNHKSDCFEKTKKKLEFRKQGKSLSTNTYLLTSGKKWNREINAASLDMLGAVSVLAARAGDDTGNQQACSGRFLLGGYNDYKTPVVDYGILERSTSFDTPANDRETAAADVLAGICGSISSEAMSSCITSSVDPGEGCQEWKLQKMGSVPKQPLTPEVAQNVDDETCSDESCGEIDSTDWTDEEKFMFIQAVASFGKDFAIISRCVRTRSRDQCKVFFSKARKCLGLDLIHPVPGNEETTFSDDVDGGGSDNEYACVVETNSAICSNKSPSKMDVDLPSSALDASLDESDPGGSGNLQTDLEICVDKTCLGQLDSKEEAESIENLVSDECQIEEKPAQLLGGDCNVVNSVSEIVRMHVQENAVMSAEAEVGRDKMAVEDASVEELSLVGEVFDTIMFRSKVIDDKAVGEIFVDEVRTESEGQEHSLLGNCLSDIHDEHGKSKAETSGQSSLTLSSLQNLNVVGDASLLGVTSGSEFSYNLDGYTRILPELNCMQKSNVGSLQEGSSLVNAKSVTQDATANQCEKTLDQDISSSTLDFEETKGKHLKKESESVDDHSQHMPGPPSVNCVESSQTLGHPLDVPTKSEMNGDISCKKHSAVPYISKVDRNFQSGFLTHNCYLQKCNGSKSHSSASELSFSSHNSEQTSDHPRACSRSSSDTEKPSRNGDVKLFGQILSHPSSSQKPNSSGNHENGDNGNRESKSSSKFFNGKVTGQQSVDGNSVPLKFDRNNYLGLENLPMRSYGFWDGNRIQTGFSALPDSAILLAKYPTAFRNYPASASKLEQQPLQAVVKSNEHNLNGVTVFPTREISGSNGVADFQVYRSRDGSKVQPFAVDMKQRQDMYSEMQRRNGLEAVSSMQQARVGMNVGRPGILVGGACAGVSDPVAAIKMHYAKTDQYGGQVGSMIIEEEPWRGTGDIGR